MVTGSISLAKAVEQFLASPQAKAGMKLELNGFIRRCGADCPVFLAANEIKGYMKGAKKAADKKKRADTLEAIFEFAYEQGWVSSNPAVGLIKEKKETKVEVKPAAPVQQIILSSEGHEKIKAEIDELIVQKNKVIEEVAAAREEGDLSENAGYHDARERLGLIEGQIMEKEHIIARAIIKD